MAISTARLLRTGSVPGRPRQTGQTLVFGGSPKRVEQPQKIFVRVRSWAWTSSPITGSYFASNSGVTADSVANLVMGQREIIAEAACKAVCSAASQQIAKNEGIPGNHRAGMDRNRGAKNGSVEHKGMELAIFAARIDTRR